MRLFTGRGYRLEAITIGYHWTLFMRLFTGRGYRWRLSLDTVHEAVCWQRMLLADAIVGGYRHRLSLNAVHEAIPWERMPLAEPVTGLLGFLGFLESDPAFKPGRVIVLSMKT